MNMNFLRTSTLALAAIVCASSAGAAVMSADFRSENDLPAFTTSGARVLERLGQALPNTGFELDNSDEIANPTDWGGMLQVDFDPVTNIVTLTPDAAGWFYQTIDIVVSNMTFSAGQHVTGFTPISTGNAVAANTGTFSVMTAFTTDSLTISYFADDIPAFEFFGLSDGDDTFQVTLSQAATVPLPAALPLMAVALAGLGFVARRR